MGIIRDEYEESKAFELEKIKDKDIVKVNKENVYKVEAMIRTDSDYKNASKLDKIPDEAYKNFFKSKDIDNSSAPKFKYCGSAAYWINQLMDILKKDQDVTSDKYNYKEVMRGVVYAIDRENSTHLNQDKIGRNIVSQRLSDLNPQKLKLQLKNPKSNNYELIDFISRTKNYEKDKGEHCHFSFATKFCHYVCLELYKDSEYEDNFSIYDSVLSKALPKYIKEYIDSNINVKEEDFKNDYSKYIMYIDEIRKNASERNNEKVISRNGFDHLIWYYHKGRN